MRWDEDTFGLEYDLDLFNIVAVDDFNMGVSVTVPARCPSSSALYHPDNTLSISLPQQAMENKSLNIFNSRLVLASPETATDGDYARIEGVVGHEYFHNWWASGNLWGGGMHYLSLAFLCSGLPSGWIYDGHNVT